MKNSLANPLIQSFGTGLIIVQEDIWCNSIRAANIETYGKTTAQEIDAKKVISDGNILVGAILSIEELAESSKNILCGETAYGAGKVVANTVITAEPLDLDGGAEVLFPPNTNMPQTSHLREERLTETIDFDLKQSEFAKTNNFCGYLDLMISTAVDTELISKFQHWKIVLEKTNAININDISRHTDIALLVWLAEIINSSYFKEWDNIAGKFHTLVKHISDKVDIGSVTCEINSYTEWLNALRILSENAGIFEESIYKTAFELVVSKLGLKSNFVTARLNEKGWQAYAE